MISINVPNGMLNCSNTVKTKQNLTVPCSEFLQKSFQNKDQIKQNQWRFLGEKKSEIRWLMWNVINLELWTARLM